MDNPWKCPACGVCNAPGVTSHRCDDGSCLGGGAIIVVSPPIPPGFYRCSSCGTHVPNGQAHQCWTYVPQPTWYPVTFTTCGSSSMPNIGGAFQVKTLVVS